MKTLRTIIIILGILVAGAAFNETFAQSKDTESREEIAYAHKRDHSRLKHKDFKNKDFKNKEYKSELKAKHKSHKCKNKTHKPELKTSLKNNDKDVMGKMYKREMKERFKGRPE
jgi:hypothetical protein